MHDGERINVRCELAPDIPRLRVPAGKHAGRSRPCAGDIARPNEPVNHEYILGTEVPGGMEFRRPKRLTVLGRENHQGSFLPGEEDHVLIHYHRRRPAGGDKLAAFDGRSP